MCGWQVKLCDPFVTHGPYLSAFEIRQCIIKRYTNSPSFFYLHQHVLCFRKQDEQETRQKFAEVDTDADGLLTWPEYAGKVFGYSEDELLKFAQSTDPELQTFNRVSIIRCHALFWTKLNSVVYWMFFTY